MVPDYPFFMQNFKQGKSILFTVTIIALLTLPVVFSPSVTAVTTSASAGTPTSTEQLTNTQAEFIGEVDVGALPAPSEGIATALSLTPFSPSTQAQSAAGGFTIVTPGSQSIIHIVKDFARTPGTNPNPSRCSPP